uniref:Uncharacterized protein n=1 Tax=Graphocephala atropunctata TaxID=36148 RepID=A0A1B6LHW5_9HEMI
MSLYVCISIFWLAVLTRPRTRADYAGALAEAEMKLKEFEVLVNAHAQDKSPCMDARRHQLLGFSLEIKQCKPLHTPYCAGSIPGLSQAIDDVIAQFNDCTNQLVVSTEMKINEKD